MLHHFVELLTNTVTLTSVCTCFIVLNQRMAFVLPQFSLGLLSRSCAYAAKAGRCCQRTAYSMDFTENLVA